MRTQRIPWRETVRPEKPRVSAHANRTSFFSSSSGPRWRGQLLGGLLILLALAILYNAQESRTLLHQLETYLTGQPAVTTMTTAATKQAVGPADAQSLTQELQSVTLAAQGQDWQLATDELRASEASWARLESTYGKAGIGTADLNGFTADLANLALAISEKDVQQVQTTVQNAQKSLAWMTTNYVSGSGPTFQEMSGLVTDLNLAATKQDWTKVEQDAKLLQQMMQSIEQGF